jgi:hypothetical protein
MIMKKLVLLILSVSAISSLSAQVGKKIKGNGNKISEQRSVGPYDGIGLSGWFNVELVSGNEGDLTLKGDENLLEHLETVVKNGTLYIRPEKGYNLQSGSWNSGGITITVPVKSINEIALSGSGSITSRTKITADFFKIGMSGSGESELDISAEEIKVALSGSGDISLKGEAKHLELQVSGSGGVRAYELQAQDTEAIISGSANIYITATASLTARVSGSGDVHYRGNPSKIDSKTIGSGNVSAEN